MTDKHDFKAALEAQEKLFSDDNPYFNVAHHLQARYLGEHKETIQTALRLADRLQSGQPTRTVLNEMIAAGNPFRESPSTCCEKQFKAMAAQMMKEINDD